MRSGVDLQRLLAAVRAPGADPRVWVALATVETTGVDEGNGVYVDVLQLPTGERETCLVGTGYAGNGFGAWWPLAVGDLVVVLVPRGDPAMGPVVVARLWTASEPPPKELGSGGSDAPTSPVIVVGPGQTVRVICRPGATLEVTSDAPGASADPVSLSTPTDRNFARLATVFQSWTPVPLDGGAALKLLLTQMLAGVDAPDAGPWPQGTAAELLKGE